MVKVLTTKPKSKGTQGLLEVLDVSALLVVMASQMCACAHAHQVVHMKYVQFLSIKYTSVQLVFKSRMCVHFPGGE